MLKWMKSESMIWDGNGRMHGGEYFFSFFGCNIHVEHKLFVSISGAHFYLIFFFLKPKIFIKKIIRKYDIIITYQPNMEFCIGGAYTN